jgi:DNA-binding NarL/FixJ family response regulator
LILRQYPDVRVVLMSGFDDPAMREECTLAGAHGFLAKMSVTSELPVLLRQLFPAEQAA